MTCANICNGIILVFLLVACIALFVLHSLYFIFRNTDQSTKTEVKTVLADELSMPALLICNRMPFSQDGINSINSQVRQDTAIRYLREWTNPSMRESADYFPAAGSFMQQGGNILMQYLSTLNRNDSIQRMLYQCQSVISTCTYQSVQLSSYDCCKNVLSVIPTTQGICWLWNDRSMRQNDTGVDKQLHIVFQISRNSWYSSSYMPVHPGVDVYLREDGGGVMDVVGGLVNPVTMRDKRGVRLRMHKERRAQTNRLECGQSLGDAQRSDNSAANGNRTNLLMCDIMVSIRQCNCHPLFAEMMPYDVIKYRDFSMVMNRSNVCTVEQYDNCSRKYIELTRPDRLDDKVGKALAGWEQLDKCRSDNHRTCVVTTYPEAIDTYDLPGEYQNTQDFVSRLTLEYSTMRVTEVLESKDPNLYELLSYIGYNLALWFAIGHILWSLYANCRDAMCGSKNNKISPSPSSSERFLSQPSNPPPAVAPIEVTKEEEIVEQPAD